MESKVLYKLISKDGSVLLLPPYPLEGKINLAEPDVYAESVAQLYPLGTLAWYPGMGKKYRYAKAGGNLVGVKHLHCNANFTTGASTTNLNGFYDGASIVTWPVGATEFTFTDTIVRPKNYYAGAHLIHFDGALDTCFEESYIVSSTEVTVAGSYACTVQLHKPTKYAKFSGEGIEIWLNPYSNIQQCPGGSEAHVTFMGVPPIPVANGRYFWLQTAGPVFITPNGWGSLIPGYAADSRVCMTISGILTTQAEQGAGHQVIGTLLCRTSNTHGAAWLNMDLDLGS